MLAKGKLGSALQYELGLYPTKYSKELKEKTGKIAEDILPPDIMQALAALESHRAAAMSKGTPSMISPSGRQTKSSYFTPSKKGKSYRKIIIEGKKFFDKAIKEEWWKTVKEEKGAPLNKTNNAGEYIYINTNTKEGRIVASYLKNIVKFYGKDKYEQSLMRNLSEAEFQDAQNKIKFINDGLYITRSITQKGLDVLNIKGKAQKRALNTIALDMALAKAKEKYGKDLSMKELEKKIYEGEPGETLIEISLMQAKEKLIDGMLFNPGKMDIKYIKDRHTLQDLYVPDKKGKLHRTYEWDWDKTGLPYAQGMSKFYATISVFPDVVRDLKPGNNLNKIFEPAELSAMLGKDVNAIRTVKEIVQRELGLDNSGDMFGWFHKFQSALARITVQGKLSFPTTGLNNLLYGTAARIYAYRLRHQARGLLDVIADNAKITAKGRRAGAYDIGKVMYEGTGPVDKILNLSLMKTGLIKPTESVNRILDIAASKYDQKYQFEQLELYPKTHVNHRRAIDALKTKYELTNKEIELRKKYSTVDEVVQDASILSEYERTRTILKWNAVNDKMNVFAHVNVQGSSATPFQPYLAGNVAVRPWMVFKTMAYMNTTRTSENIRHAMRYGNLIRPVMGTTSHLAAGMIRAAVYQKLWNAGVPDEWEVYPWKWIKNTLWYGGFGGVLTDIVPGYSPYGSGINDDHVAIYQTFNSMRQEFDYVLSGKKTIAEGTGSFAEDNIMLYGQNKKYLERTDNPLRNAKLNGDRVEINKYETKFKENFKNQVLSGEGEKSERALLYENLRNYFYLGTKQEFHDELISTALELTSQIFGQKRGVYPTELKGITEEKVDAIIYRNAWEEAWELLFTKDKVWNPYTYTFKKDNSSSQIISSQFFLYTAGLMDEDGNYIGEDDGAARDWIYFGGNDSRGNTIENPMTGYPLKLWNFLHDSEERYGKRLKEYGDFVEIAEYLKTLYKDPVLNLDKIIGNKKSSVYKAWENLFTP